MAILGTPKVGTAIRQRLPDGKLGPTCYVVDMKRRSGYERRCRAVYPGGRHELVPSDLPFGCWEFVDPPHPIHVIAAKRADGWQHYGVVCGHKVIIDAGCRHFTSIAKARRHWAKHRRFFSSYKGSRVMIRFGRADAYGNRRSVFVHTTKAAARKRAKDAELNKWSLAFVRKVERLLAKNQ